MSDGANALELVRQDEFILPQYLEPPRPGVETFGTLKRNWTSKGTFWEIHGHPQAVIMAKRLFPGSEGRGDGVAKFPATPRNIPDLVWFLQRWPMEIEEPALWETEYQAACALTLRKMRLARHPEPGLPDPSFKGTLKRFQEEGHSWLMTNRKTLLADEMGLGKTVSALAFLASAKDWPALLVVPPHLVPHWRGKSVEFLEVAPEEQSELPLFRQASEESSNALLFHTIRGLKPYELPPAQVYIIHYLLLRAWKEALKEMGMPTIIFDEVQELRHTGTEKYSAASDLSGLATSVIGLSGTPIYNRGAEIWNVLNAIEYHCLGDFDSFSREWCIGYGRETVKDPKLLGEYLRREGLMLRRRKEDVLDDLPPKRRIVQTLEANDGVFKELVDAAIDTAIAAEGLPVLARGRAELDAVNETRQATGMAKVDAVAVFVKALLDAGEPTLLFVYHHAVVDALLKILAEYKPVCITGRQDKDEKAESIRIFSEGKTTDLCIISLRVATGLDGLQKRARVVVFGELDWSPAVHSQCEDRAHRMEQKDSVLCYYLVSEIGTDPDIQEALGLKVSQFVGLMGDRADSEEDRALASQATTSHMKRIVEKLRVMGKDRGRRRAKTA